MKRTVTTRKFLIVIAAFLLASCGRKSDDSQPQAKPNLLTASPWKNAKNEWRTTGGSWVAPPSWAHFDFYPGLTVTFFDNGSYSSSSGGAGTWQISAGTTLTVFTSAGGSGTFAISSLTGSTLQFTEKLNPDDNYTVAPGGSPITYYDMSRTTLTH